MNNKPMDPDQIRVDELAGRAKKLIGRRAMLGSTARKIALPVVATYMVSRSDLAVGSGGMMMMM